MIEQNHRMEFEQMQFFPIQKSSNAKDENTKDSNVKTSDSKNDNTDSKTDKTRNNNKVNRTSEYKAVFLNHYTFKFSIDDITLKKIVIGRNFIQADATEKALNNEVSRIIDKGFESLTNTMTSRRTIYIHKNSAIPLIGTNLFGIVDRNTNCIEIKPLTGCNLNCIYCSVDEGCAQETGKTYDYLVEEEYLINELKRLLDLKHKTDKGLEIHIGPQGEPLLYPQLIELISDISKISGIKRISMDTNGLLLSENFIDELVAAGLTRFNISLNSMDKKVCDKISNRQYNHDHLMRMIKYIDKRYATCGKCEIIIAPVLLDGINDSQKELDALIEFSKELSGLKNGIKIGIQNFLYYKNGRNPVKEKDWKEFFALLKENELKHKTKLILDADDFLIEKNAVLEKPFVKGDIIRAEIKCTGAYKDERIAAASQRSITVHDCDKDKGQVRLKIVRDKHNVFDAVLIK